MHLFRGAIANGDALDMEVHRFRILYNTIRPHQAHNDRTPARPTSAMNSGRPLDKRHFRTFGFQ
ncbi:integrase core domain-containing protein [Nocardia sp. NPDC049707]|uniref:integrase core domain-containing protein n=1 Tax=Nocardia sp. NPDC049707 TaxID=3154735 RepID=UPI00344AC29B